MKEEYRKIEGFENYEISNLGNVRNMTTGKILTQQKRNDGYKHLNLTSNYKIKGVLIHRLIAVAFIPNPDNKPNVDHIDNNRSNNDISNLRWCSQQENMCNKKVNTTSQSGIKGVSHHKETNLYQAKIKHNGITRTIGYYKTTEDAIIVSIFVTMVPIILIIPIRVLIS